MRNEIETRDPLLAKLFAIEEEALSETEFLQQLYARLEREQRKKHWSAVASALAIGLLVLLVTFAFSGPISTIGHFVTLGVNEVGVILQSPLAWTIGAALILAAMPIVYVWRGNIAMTTGLFRYLYFSRMHE